MATAASLFLIAVGAILYFAVNATVSGLDIRAVGVILMIVGGFGLVLSLAFGVNWGDHSGRRRSDRFADDDRRARS
jgi:hypothetical protein